MKQFYFLLSAIFLSSGCTSQKQDSVAKIESQEKLSELSMETYFLLHTHNGESSISKGLVSKGSLENGKIVPFRGVNYSYFDSASYVNGRGFSNKNVVQTIEDMYASLHHSHPGRHFCVMECSNEHGGKLAPHLTHQNGLSVDFMVPLMKDSKPYYGLDSIGAEHYWLTFDDDGKFIENSTISIDFELLATKILVLDEMARKNGLKIAKVLFKIELKDNLFSGESGTLLKNSKIKFAQSLPSIINGLHDDHFHVDFELL